MAYDKQKAHEYYENYTKKGKLKGRKKGKAKKKSSKNGKKTNLVGLSTSGLNDEGKIEYALMKEKVTAEMNSALSRAKTDAEKDSIRREYQKKALSELNRIKSDSRFAAPKKTKASSGSKSSGAKGKSSGTKSGSSSGKSSGSKNSSSKSADVQKLNEVANKIAQMTAKIASLSTNQKALAKEALGRITEMLKGLKGVNVSSITKALEGMSR